MKKAFTLIELVFVIVVIGVLASTIIPRTNTNPVAEASVDLLSKIRYTQHLSMVNDKYGVNNWFKDRWQIVFSGNSYSIISDNSNTYAHDPLDSNVEINAIELKGLSAISLSERCSGDTISFDYLGRPLIGTLNSMTTSYVSSGHGALLVENSTSSRCVITLTDGTKTSYIDIVPETGYASIR